MTPIRLQLADEADTDCLGAALAAHLPDGTTVALIGTLGAGKTRLVQALAAACGTPRDEVVSPTFVLCQEYHGTRDLYHLDAYRLRDEDEFLQLGPEEYFDSDAITLVEWGDRVLNCLPTDRVEIRIDVLPGTARTVELVATAPHLEAALAQVATALSR